MTDIDPEEMDWINSYAAEVTTVFGVEFGAHVALFKNSKAFLQRFTEAVTSMLSNGRSFIAAVDEAHNELCVASQLLGDPSLTMLEYEPSLPGCARSIDFRAYSDSGLTIYIDVKTIKPQPKDPWPQFEKAIKERWFPENVRVTLSKPWLGGELWHNMFTARSRMLEHAVGLEAKIRESNLSKESDTFCVLVLCGAGFHWHQDQLEDFVCSTEGAPIEPRTRSLKPRSKTSSTTT